jgi:hypothetical protein
VTSLSKDDYLAFKEMLESIGCESCIFDRFKCGQKKKQKKANKMMIKYTGIH